MVKINKMRRVELGSMVIVLFCVFLAGCGMSKNPGEMYLEANGYISNAMYQEDGGEIIKWEDREYHVYGWDAAPLAGVQIGILDGDTDRKVYSVQGYPQEEWIILWRYSEKGWEHAAVPYKEVGVDSIPADLEEYTYGTRSLIMNKIMKGDGVQAIVNSGMGWGIFLNEEEYRRFTEGMAEFTGIDLGALLQRYIGRGIDISSLNTLPIGLHPSQYSCCALPPNEMDDVVLEDVTEQVYFFIFYGQDLLFHHIFADEEQFEPVKRLCIGY